MKHIRSGSPPNSQELTASSIEGYAEQPAMLACGYVMKQGPLLAVDATQPLLPTTAPPGCPTHHLPSSVGSRSARESENSLIVSAEVY